MDLGHPTDQPVHDIFDEIVTRQPSSQEVPAGGAFIQTPNVEAPGGAKKLNYATVSATDVARIHNGDVVNNYYTDGAAHAGRILNGDSVGLLNFWDDDNAKKTHSEMLRVRNRYQSRRESSSPKVLQQKQYTPYALVKNRTIRSILAQIATRFQSLDRGFAELFRNYVPSAYRSNVEERLVEIRELISKQQSHEPNGTNGEASTVYLGDLGQFCERLAACWSQEDARPVALLVFSGPQERFFHYLEDAHEVPYWKLMLEIFLAWKGNSNSDFGNIVLRMLGIYKLDVLVLRNRLLTELGKLTGDEAEQIEPILKGIDDRIKVLEEAWDGDAALLEDSPLLEALFRNPTTAVPAETSEKPESQPIVDNTKQTIILMGLIITFLIGAIVPGYMAFAISWQTKAPGLISDADFWNLFQNTIMAVLANLVTIVPLMKESWFSPAYALMWTFLALGTACAVVSLVIYPFCNPAWSSVIGFLGTVFASTGVLILTQATARSIGRDGKVKKE